MALLGSNVAGGSRMRQNCLNTIHNYGPTFELLYQQTGEVARLLSVHAS